MLRRILLGLILAGAAGVGIFWWLTVPAVVAPASLAPRTPNLANGITTFNAGGCSSCHAVPNQPDRLKLGGGLAMPSPFGTFYVPNISSDPTYGIGRWSEADFVTALLKGTSPDGQHYFPAFPYASYQHASVEDVRDLFAYLKTLAPVAGKPRDHDVPFPFNIRLAFGVMESRRLSRQRSRPLRRVPQPAQLPRRYRRGATLRGRAQSGGRGLGAQHHPEETGRVEREGYRLLPRNRANA
jgi:mono/diheme cytochrome c family protein